MTGMSSRPFPLARSENMIPSSLPNPTKTSFSETSATPLRKRRSTNLWFKISILIIKNKRKNPRKKNLNQYLLPKMEILNALIRVVLRNILKNKNKKSAIFTRDNLFSMIVLSFGVAAKKKLGTGMISWNSPHVKLENISQKWFDCLFLLIWFYFFFKMGYHFL